MGEAKQEAASLIARALPAARRCPGPMLALQAGGPRELTASRRERAGATRLIPCSRAGGEKGNKKDAVNSVLVSCSSRPLTAALRDPGLAAGARQRAAPEQRLPEGHGRERCGTGTHAAI